ncbi:hypothetical protein V6N13_091167 [Hibiscus sabdariffa]
MKFYMFLNAICSSKVKILPVNSLLVKALLCQKGTVSGNILDLFFFGNLLKDDERLVGHGIQRNSIVHLVFRNFDGVKLLKDHHNKGHLWWKQGLKEVKEGIESYQFSLIYGAKLLEGDKTLISLKLKNESTVHVVFCQKDVLLIYVRALTGEVAKLEVKVTFSVFDVNR